MRFLHVPAGNSSINRGLLEECCTSLPADWQVECKEDGVGRMEKAPCETNISALYGVDTILMPYIQDKIISE
jgi:hypothetical protein